MFTTHESLGWTISSALGTLQARRAEFLSWLEGQAATHRGEDPLRGLPPQIRGDIGLSDNAERARRGGSEPGRALRDLPSSS